MRCKICDYPLWNLSARQCPECGAGFKPSEYEFVPNSVRFCCPHCDQPYYGNLANGHLEPLEFDCVRCHQRTGMDEMVLRPAEGVEEVRTRVDSMPWFEREERGLIKAWFATIGRAMTRPQSLMRAIPEDVSLGRAWSFMFVNNALFQLVGQILPGTAFVVLFWVLGPRLTGSPAIGRMITVQTLMQYAGMLFGFAVLPVIWVWLTHGLLAVSGGTGAPMRRTAHAIYYSAAAGALSAVPCLKNAGTVWWLVSAILMVKAAHRCHGGRATFAVLGSAGILAIPIAVIAIAPALLWVGMGPLSGGGFGSLLGAVSETKIMTQSVITYAEGHGGRGPDHASMLIAVNTRVAGDFVSVDSGSDHTQVPIGETTLDQFQLIPQNRRALAAQAAADALPEGTVAHRLGDFLFTYHGADLSTAPAGLWVVVFFPDPDVNGLPSPATLLYVGRGNKLVIPLTFADLLAELPAQNRFRQAQGLPPLPDLTAITHGNPGVAPQ